MTRPIAYRVPGPLQLTRVEMIRGAYCPPPIDHATWSPVAGAFVLRDSIPDHSPTFIRSALKGAVYFLAVFGLFNLIAGRI
jgi:hypothetical protein